MGKSKNNRKRSTKRAAPRTAKPRRAVKRATRTKPKREKGLAYGGVKARASKARVAKRPARPKVGRKKHPNHLRTETIGFALYEADKRTLSKGCAKRDITKSSAFRLAIRLWEKGGFQMDEQALMDKVRGNRDPIRVAREQAAKNRATKGRTAKRPTRRARTTKTKAPRAAKSARASKAGPPALPAGFTTAEDVQPPLPGLEGGVNTAE